MTAAEEPATILIVDDEESILETFELYLGEEYDIRTASNGGEALVEFGSDVDVVLLDRRMPGMSGDEVLEHIRDWGENCRVAMVTAVDPGPDIVDMPFDDYLSKPVDRQQLFETVQQLLLFDEYERLLNEYHSVTKTYGTLKSHADGSPGDVPDELDALEARQQALRDELQSTVEQFTDEEIAAAFRDAHGVHQPSPSS